MAKFDLTTLNHIGEKLITQWLTENGYSHIEKETIHNSQDIFKAVGSKENILVQVKTFLHPNRLFKLSEYELDLLVRRGIKLQAVVYAAYLILDENGDLMGDINWERCG